MVRFLLSCIIGCTVALALGQPANDICPGQTIAQNDLDDNAGSCGQSYAGDTFGATSWVTSGGVIEGSCWPDTLNVVFYEFVAQGPTIGIEVTNGPANYYVSLVEGTCDAPVELACGANMPIFESDLLTDGSTYIIAVGFEGDIEGNFDICVFNPEPADNDQCNDAWELTQLDGQCYSTAPEHYYYPTDDGINAPCFTDPHLRVWFSFTAQGVSIADLHIEGGPDVANVAIFDFEGVTTCDLAAGALISCESNVDANNPIVLDNQLEIGQEYYIAVSFDNGAVGPFNICLDNPVPAFNDDCFDAFEYPQNELSNQNCQGVLSGQNLNNDWASTDFIPPPCWNNGSYSVWFWFEAQGKDVEIEVDMAGEVEMIGLAEFEPGLDCQTGTWLDCAAGETLDFNDELEIGNIYYVMVGFEDNAIGDYCLDIFNPVPPDNDTVCAALPLPTDGSCNGGPACVNYCYTTEYANPELADNQVLPECIPYLENSVWFTIQLDDPNNVGFEFTIGEGTGSDFGMIIGTFDDCSGNFDPEAFFCGVGSDPVEWGPVDDAQLYYVMIGSEEVNEGTFTICVNEIPPCFDNNFCEDPMGISSANDLGIIPTTSSDGNGNCADAGDPFTCVEGCNLFADEIDVAANCLGTNDPVVWYTFQTDANAALINILMSSNDFEAPAFQLYQSLDGTCGDLIPIGACTVGSGGESTLTGEDVGGGNTYYLAVGGVNTAGGDFEVCISILENLSACVLASSVTVTGRSFSGPLEGPFFPSETVSLCMNVDAYTSAGNNCQWLQGIIPTFGNGWDPSSFDAAGMPNGATINGNSMPAPGISGGTVWEWFEPGVVTYHHDNCFYNVGDFDGNGTLDMCNALYDDECTGPGLTGGASGPCWQDLPGNILPGGWFAYGIQGLCPIGGEPTVDYGDGTCCGCTMGPWNVCFDLTVRPYPDCDQDETTIDLSVGFITVADGEVGSWNGGPSVCANDEPLDVKLPGCCVEVENLVDVLPPICTNGLFSWVLDYPGVDFWQWSADAGGVIGASSGEGPPGTIILDNLVNQGAGSSIVTYNILGFDGGECPAVIWEVSVEVFPEITVDIPSFTACATPTNPYQIVPNVMGGDPSSYIFEWYDGSSGSSLVLPNPQAGIQYTVTVTDATGCSGVGKVVLDVYETFEVTIDDPVREQCLQDGPISLNATANGGVPSYNFDWTSPSGSMLNGSPIGADETGQWLVIATDNEGCTGRDSTTLEFFEAPEVEVDPVSICPDALTPAQVTASISGGTQPYDVLWENDQGWSSTSNPAQVTEVANYSVTVTDRNGCTDTYEFVVEEREAPNVDLGTQQQFCADELAQGVDLSVPDDPSYVFVVWSTGDIGPRSVTITEPGDYSVTVTNDGGCVVQDQVTIAAYDPLPDVFQDTIPYCEFIFIDPDPTYTYEWDDGQTIPPFSFTEGLSFVTVTDANGCTAEEEVYFLEENTVQPNIIADSVICNGVAIQLSTTTGYSSYRWTDEDGIVLGIGSIVPTDITTPGWYYLQVTTDQGCPGIDSILIYESDPTPMITGDQAICDGDAASLDVPGNWSEILWSTGDTTQSVSIDSAGSYTVTVTDILGCSGVAAPFELVVAQAPVFSVTGDDRFCPGSSSILDAGPGFASYLWSTGDVTQTTTVDSAQTVTVTVTNAIGCASADTIVITVDPTPTPKIAGDSLICGSGSVVLDAGGGYVAYLWTGGEDSRTLNVSAAGTYTVTVTDANGCTGTDSKVVQAGDPTPEIDGEPAVCDGGSEMLTASSGFASYAWSTGDVGQSIQVDSSGRYFVTVTDVLGCVGITSFDFTVYSNPTPNINGSTTFCVGSSTTLDAGSGYVDYQWSGAGGQAGQVVTVSSPGTVSVTVTDDNGCTGVASVDVIESTELALNVQDTAICTGESVVLIVGSFDNYLWSTGDMTPTIEVSRGDTYSVTVSDAGGCTGTAEIVVDEFQEPFATVTPEATTCNTSAEGSIIDFSTLVIGGDTGGSWSEVTGSGASGAFPILDFDGVAFGKYEFQYTTATAQGPCEDQSYIVTINVINCVCPSPEITDGADQCNDNSIVDLSTLLTASSEPGGEWTIISTPGGSNPATIAGTTFQATDADPGVYEIQYEIFGAPAGCVTTDVAQIVVNEPGYSGLPLQPAQICVGEDTTVSLVALLDGQEDAGGYWVETSINMSQAGFDASTGTFNPVLELPDIYTFAYVVPGTAPCPEAMTTVEVVVEELPFADAGPDRKITCDDPEVILDGSGSSQGANFAYNWYVDGNLVASEIISPIVNDPGLFELVVLNRATGCSASDFVEVAVDDDVPVLATPEVNSPSCIGEGTASVRPTAVSGGSEPFTYTLNGAIPTSDGVYENLAPGDYTLRLEDVNGCEDSYDFTISVPTEVDGQISGEFVVERGDSTVLYYNLSVGTADSVVWYSVDGTILCDGCDSLYVTVTENTEVFVTIYDENKCEVTLSASLFVIIKREVFVPNVFTPNSDGENDYVTVYGEEGVIVRNLEVFTRWGELVYQRNDDFPASQPQLGWDGTHGGEVLQPGVYVFHAQVLYPDGFEETVKGDITLLK